MICPTVNDAVKVRMEGGVLEECEASADVLLSDTMDQYRTFQMCERLLHSPAKLANQLLFQIPPHRQTVLIERCRDNNDNLFNLEMSDLYVALFMIELGYSPLKADTVMAFICHANLVLFFFSDIIYII